MIPGGLVAMYGLRTCPLSCVGLCAMATARAGGSVVASPDCQLMMGSPPTPGLMPSLDHHSAEQLARMCDYSPSADAGITAAAERQLARRRGAP